MTTATCVDSSALLRVCLAEGELEAVRQALRGLAAVSVVAAVEMPCAVTARFHRGLIDDEERRRLLGSVAEVLGDVAQIGLTAAVRREAVDIAAQHLIRALDAIHLATAAAVVRQQRRRGNVARFCTADLRQADAARHLFGASQVDLVPPLPPLG